MRVYEAHQPAAPQSAASAFQHNNAEVERLRAAGVVQAAQECLQRTPFSVLRQVYCTYAAGVLTLEGQLPSFYLKQIAQECLRGMAHVCQVDNRIEVHS